MTEKTSGMNEFLRSYLSAVEQMMEKARKGDSRYHFNSLEGFVLKCGFDYIKQPLPSNYERGYPKHCFHNSYDLAVEEGLIYVEGYAAGIIPIQHAWCIEPGSNKVIDVTTDALAEYVGIPFKMDYVKAHYDKHGAYNGSVIDNWSDGHPLLKMTIEQIQPLIQGIINE